MTDETTVDETANFVVTSSDEPVFQNEDPPTTDEAENTAPSDESAKEDENKASDDATTEDDTPANKPSKKGGFKKRVVKLVKQREEARQKSESLEKRNQELEEQLASKKDDKKTDDLKEPKEGDFETYDEYLDALDGFDKAGDSSSKETDTKNQKPSTKDDSTDTALSDAQRTAMAVIKEKVSDAADTYSDFEEIALNKDVPITGDMLEALAECDDPAKVMMILGNDQELASQIADASPIQQMREITRLDMSESKAQAKPIKKTNASDPITPVGGSDAQEKPISEMSFKEYETKMNKQERSAGDKW